MAKKELTSISDRLAYIQALNNRVEHLNRDRVNECKEAIWKSYEASTLCLHIANLSHDFVTEPHKFRSIGIRSMIKLSEFNAPNYRWTLYFSDVGRAITNGEQKYLYERLGRQVTGEHETISRSSPDFRILDERVSYLARNNIAPDTLLAPIGVFVDFMKYYGSRMDWSHGRPEQVLIQDCKLKVFWSHKYAKLRSFIIFDSKAGTWHTIPDRDTGRAITIALGESEQKPSYVEYWVETLVRYKITNRQAFSRITLSY